MRLYKYFICILVAILCSSCEKDDLEHSFVPTLVAEDSVLKDDNEYIVVIGDIQEYTSSSRYALYYASTINWIWSQYNYGKKIKCILQVGDVTNNNTRSQYELFQKYTYNIAREIPYISCTGNHDYEWEKTNIISDRYSTRFSQYACFDLTDSLIETRFEHDRFENIIVKNEISGKRYDIIALEFGPRPQVIDWVDTYISKYPSRRYILMTHEYLRSNGERIKNSSYAETHFRNSPPSYYSTPEQLWNKLIKNNNNIVGVICGHNGFYAYSTEKNIKDRNVPQILFNLQYQNNGGDGWVQIWEFSPNQDYANVFVYNTITRQYYSDNKNHFQFIYKY